MMTTIEKAAEILRSGGLVAFPTETVYGLGADARQADAVRKIFLAKNRPENHPLIVHIASVAELPDWAIDIPEDAYRAAEAYWPGPLTLILQRRPDVLDSVTGGQKTIGLRVPRHPIAQALLTAFGSGIAAPSANQFTHISPTTAEAVFEELGSRVDLILDGGLCEVGLESTILDLSGDKPVILRPGMILQAALEAILGKPVLVQSSKEAIIRAPGMHDLHYAPRTYTQLAITAALPAICKTLAAQHKKAVCVLHSALILPHQDFVETVYLSADPTQYAHDLYRTLRTLDEVGFESILIEAVPESAEWAAIRDRLSKAAKFV